MQARQVQSLWIQFPKRYEPAEVGGLIRPRSPTRFTTFISEVVKLRNRGGGFNPRRPPPEGRPPRECPPSPLPHPRGRELGARRLAAPRGTPWGAEPAPEGGEADLPSRGPGVSPGPSAGEDHFLEAEGAGRTLGTLQGMRMSS